MQKQIAIQMDNIETIDFEFDTSFLIGYEAQQRNYKIFYYNPNDLIIQNGDVQANGQYVKLKLDENNYLFHAGTRKRNNKIEAIGGRVLNFISLSDEFKNSRQNIHENLKKLDWKKGFYRKDIAYKVISK